MLTETTVSKLREMRLSVMANALKDQLADPQFQNMTFEDRLGLLVDAEWNARKNNHLNKLIRQATFSDPGACLENVEYLPDRGLKQEELLRFRHLQLHSGAPQHHPAGSYRQRQNLSRLRSGHGCRKTVLYGEVHPAPGSSGRIPDCQGQRYDSQAHGPVQEVRIAHN